MPVNTTGLDDGQYVTTSSLSLAGSAVTFSAATLKAGYIYASAISVAPGSLVVTAPGVGSYNQLQGGSTAISPDLVIGSEVSLGFYRSAASVIALSYGFLQAPAFISSSTTNQSASSAKVPNQGQIVFSILSLTTNGCAMYYRSGNSVFGFASSLVVG